MTFEKFKKLPWRKKVEHLWEYYRWSALLVLAGAVIVGSWISTFLSQPNPQMVIEMINSEKKAPNTEMFREFFEQEIGQFDESDIQINQNVRMDEIVSPIDAISAQRLVVTLAAGETDLVFWDGQEELPILGNGAMQDLRDVLPKEVLTAHQDDLVYTKDQDTGERYPCGIYLKENAWIIQNGFYINCTVGVSATGEHKELAADFLQYLLAF